MVFASPQCIFTQKDMRWIYPLTFLLWLSASGQAAAATALVDAARARIGVTLNYDPAYTALGYPGGDVADDRGVCTDVVIRSLRAAYGFDLQREVHRDIAAHFDAYPMHWGLKKPDRNIDHRRVPNLEVFLRRAGAQIVLGEDAADYKAGDIVTWFIGGRLPHIGIVSAKTSPAGVPLVIHNMGRGTVEEDVLFAFPRVAQFRFHPKDDAEPELDPSR